LELFDTFHNMMAEKMIHPDLIIFLNSDVKRLELNISKRGRPYEKAIESNYLDKISKAYTGRINTMEKSKVLIINSSELDFVNNNEHLEQIIKQISINLSM
ncbi:MAG: deoxynucleoside kinase, partial [Bacteroidota bacterium]